MTPTNEAKAALRRELRAVRRAVADADVRSERIVAELRPLVERAGTVMVFSAVRGEPDLDALVEWCRARGQVVVVPEDGVDPSAVDTVIVPGVAFTPDGRRLGQGGGWYDRFLPSLRQGTRTIGVAFRECIVDDLPTEPHDVRVDRVVAA